MYAVSRARCEDLGLGALWAPAEVPALPLPKDVKVDTLVNLLTPLFPHIQSGNSSSVLPQGSSRRVNEMMLAGT